jgi:hypothetical protein
LKVFLALIGLLLLSGPISSSAHAASDEPAQTTTNLPRVGGWATSPTVCIDTDGGPVIFRNRTTRAPLIPDDDGGPAQSAITLVQDAIVEFWNEEPSVDNETENPAASVFGGAGGVRFGEVTTSKNPNRCNSEINIFFAPLSFALGVAWVGKDETNGRITRVTILLTTRLHQDRDRIADLTDENYKNVAAHELGHALGLEHNGAPGTLMYFRLDRGSDAYMPLDASSQEALARMYDSQMSALRS